MSQIPAGFCRASTSYKCASKSNHCYVYFTTSCISCMFSPLLQNLFAMGLDKHTSTMHTTNTLGSLGGGKFKRSNFYYFCLGTLTLQTRPHSPMHRLTLASIRMFKRLHPVHPGKEGFAKRTATCGLTGSFCKTRLLKFLNVQVHPSEMMHTPAKKQSTGSGYHLD